MTFQVCVIGCGDLGTAHALTWQARDDARVVALYDPLEDRRSQLAGRTGARSYPSMQEAVLHDGVNVVSVCTPACFHAEVTCFAAEQGRHVLCEKPLALTLEQADQMIAAARNHRVLLSTSFQYRAFRRNVRYRELFSEDEFGGPLFIRYTDLREVRPKLAMHRRSMNGGPVIDMAGHYFDLMRYITGAEPQRVWARGHVFGAGKRRLSGIDDLAIDAATIEVAMSGGHSLTVFVNWGMPEGFPSLSDETLVGPQITIQHADGITVVNRSDRTETWDFRRSEPAGPAARVNDLAGAILGQRPLEVTGEDGRIALAVSLAALRSIDTGDVVDVAAEGMKC